MVQKKPVTFVSAEIVTLGDDFPGVFYPEFAQRRIELPRSRQPRLTIRWL
jgi:hypothetical protein